MNTPVTIPRECCFAAVTYINALPLAHFIELVCPQARVIRDTPANLLARLRDGTADAAMIPVADLLDQPDLTMIAGLGICAKRNVRSVLLKCNRPIDEVRTVELDPASRTSNSLAQLLLRRHWKRTVQPVAPGGTPADAAVLIGDRALCTPPAPGGDYDLARAWNDLTGLPFVFAVWAHRKDHPAPDTLALVAHAARKAGQESLSGIIRLAAKRLALDESVCHDYFTNCIHYDVGPEELQAIELFRKLRLDPEARIP